MARRPNWGRFRGKGKKPEVTADDVVSPGLLADVEAKARAQAHNAAVDKAIASVGGPLTMSPTIPITVYETGEVVEREALLHPTVKGLGDGLAPMPASELNAATVTPAMALGLDRDDAAERLQRIRHWLLSDPDFERDFWASIRAGAKRGMRHCQHAILRLIYGWQEHDNLAEKLGASIEEARHALNIVGESSNMNEDDIAENVMTFFVWYADNWKDKARELHARMEEHIK